MFHYDEIYWIINSPPIIIHCKAYITFLYSTEAISWILDIMRFSDSPQDLIFQNKNRYWRKVNKGPNSKGPSGKVLLQPFLLTSH